MPKSRNRDQEESGKRESTLREKQSTNKNGIQKPYCWYDKFHLYMDNMYPNSAPYATSSSMLFITPAESRQRNMPKSDKNKTPWFKEKFKPTENLSNPYVGDNAKKIKGTPNYRKKSNEKHSQLNMFENYQVTNPNPNEIIDLTNTTKKTADLSSIRSGDNPTETQKQAIDEYIRDCQLRYGRK